MDKKDLLTFVLAIVFVIIIALVTHPPEFGSAGTGDAAEVPVQSGNTTSNYCSDSSCCSDKVQYYYITERQEPPFEIYYNNDHQTIYASGANGYPRLHLPGEVYSPAGDLYVPENYGTYENSGMERFIWSDVMSRDVWGGGIEKFAFMEGNKSGFSQIFGVPYPVWRINCTMVANGNPAYSKLMWVLVDSSTGDLITGGNIFPEGHLFKEITISDREMYFIIETENVLAYTLNLETPEITYENKYPKGAEENLINFLNTMEK